MRAALDSSPLWEAGRVEDTDNLLGHALRKAVGVIARQQGREPAAVAAEAGAELVAGPSLKATLDRDRDDPTAVAAGLGRVLAALDAVEAWLARQADPPATAPAALAIAHEVCAQDVVMPAAGAARLRQGVAAARRISVEDGEVRHGRKSRSRLFDGFRRHVGRDLDRALVRAVGITPGNVPEAELPIDRASLSSRLVRERPPDLRVKAWPVREGPTFAKTAFTLEWTPRAIRCPGDEVAPFVPGETVRFLAETCGVCELRALHHQRRRPAASASTPTSGCWPNCGRGSRPRRGGPNCGNGSRSSTAWPTSGGGRGTAPATAARKNLFDLRRCAVIHDLHVIARFPPPSRNRPSRRRPDYLTGVLGRRPGPQSSGSSPTSRASARALPPSRPAARATASTTS